MDDTTKDLVRTGWSRKPRVESIGKETRPSPRGDDPRRSRDPGTNLLPESSPSTHGTVVSDEELVVGGILSPNLLHMTNLGIHL